MENKKILIVTHEMAPYTDLTEQAQFVRDLALKAGISPSTIVRIESGLPVRHITKRKIAKALGVEPSYIDFT